MTASLMIFIVAYVIVPMIMAFLMPVLNEIELCCVYPDEFERRYQAKMVEISESYIDSYHNYSLKNKSYKTDYRQSKKYYV